MKKGHCLCGEIRWSFDGEETWACYCHCDDCRRNCAAPVAAYIGVRLKDFKWTGGQTGKYNSSSGVIRHFCSTCGTPMGFQADHYVGEIHVYAATLDDPKDFEPKFHVYHGAKLPWLGLHDDLKKIEGGA